MWQAIVGGLLSKLLGGKGDMGAIANSVSQLGAGQGGPESQVAPGALAQQVAQLDSPQTRGEDTLAKMLASLAMKQEPEEETQPGGPVQ